MQTITIAIDGYSSCGKSTLAKALAHKLGYKYIDTGAMYRAVTLYAIQNELIDKEGNIDYQRLQIHLPDIEVKFKVNHETHHSDVYLNGVDVEQEIRTMAVSGLVSKISAIRDVREKMVDLQRQMGRRKGVIMDGRDIGTVVFPKAELKLFMTADNAVRVERRFKELFEKNPNISLEEVKANLEMRDYIDSNREVSPLRKAEDAIILDNTNLTPEEQFKKALRLVHDSSKAMA